MKKIVSLILALGLCISSTCASANSAVLGQTAITASAEVSGDYEYRLLDDGTAALKLYNGSASEIKIPDWIEGKAVTAIATAKYVFPVPAGPTPMVMMLSLITLQLSLTKCSPLVCAPPVQCTMP